MGQKMNSTVPRLEQYPPNGYGKRCATRYRATAREAARGRTTEVAGWKKHGEILLGVMMMAALAQPAHAAWVVLDYPEFGEYTAAVGSEQGRAEMEISCSVDYPDDVRITIFTEETYDPETSYSDEVPVSVIAGGVQQPIAYGSFENVDDMLVVVSDTSRDETLAQVIGAMAKSTSLIGIQFYGRDLKFPPDELDTALAYLFEHCT